MVQISDSSASAMPSEELESDVPFPEIVMGELLGKGRWESCMWHALSRGSASAVIPRPRLSRGMLWDTEATSEQISIAYSIGFRLHVLVFGFMYWCSGFLIGS